MKHGYLVHSRNGRGKRHFFNCLKDALDYANKFHPSWSISEVEDNSTNELEIYTHLNIIRG